LEKRNWKKILALLHNMRPIKKILIFLGVAKLSYSSKTFLHV